MGNVLRVLARDLVRLVKAPSALIVLLAILVLPSMYSWYNVLAFWDPYGNTSNMRVCVVNEDDGGESDLTGELDVGDTIVDALHENDQLKWVFEDRESAMQDLMSGKVYAVFVIPEDFTEDLLTITSGDFVQPKIQYYVNEKTGPVSPKVTDTGSTTLEETINSTFVSTVTDILVEAVTDAVGSARVSTDSTKSQALVKVDEAVESLEEAQGLLNEANEKLAALQLKQQDAVAALDGATTALDDAATKVDGVSSKATKVQNALLAITPKLSSATGASIEKLAKLEPVAEFFGYGDEITQAIDGLQTTSTIFYSTVLPLTSRTAGDIGSATGSISSSLTGQKALVSQLKTTLSQLDTLLGNTRSSLSQTAEFVAGVESDLKLIRSDISAISASTLLDGIYDVNDNIDVQAIADFMGSPTTIRTEKLYELSSYGAGMAPLFMSLTFWIGAFMFLVVFRQEVDDEGVKNLTIGQRYVARFLFFAVPAMLQAVVCCTGLLAFGVEVVNAPAMYVASVMASLAYLSIIYALSTTLQHIGKGLCIILVFIQIPAATGLYPIEMTAGFYQAISPLFPFTYGIAAIREAICGFYGTAFAEDLIMLLVYFVLFMVAGLVFRPILSNINRMVAREIGETGLLNGEYVEVPERKYRISQALMALSDRSSYRDELQKRYDNFMHRYPQFMVVAIAACIIGPILIGLVGMLTSTDKVVILTGWLIWFVLMIVVFLALETFRYGFRSQFELNAMSDEELVKATRSLGGIHLTVHHDPLRSRAAFKFWDVFDPAAEARADRGEESEDASGPKERFRGRHVSEKRAKKGASDAGTTPLHGNASDAATTALHAKSSDVTTTALHAKSSDVTTTALHAKASDAATTALHAKASDAATSHLTSDYSDPQGYNTLLSLGGKGAPGAPGADAEESPKEVDLDD